MKKSKKKPGRPEKEVNWDLFEELCGLQCTQEEIASCLKMWDGTLVKHVEKFYNEKYSTIYKKYSEAGKTSLRRNQFILSKTNAAMAIWLGKQWLGQKDAQLENQVTPELLQHYIAVMQQVKRSQEEQLKKNEESQRLLNNLDKSMSKPSKSELETGS